jgi:hypothetical protein
MISYNSDGAYDIGMRYRIIVMLILHIVYDVCKNYDIVYNIICYVVTSTTTQKSQSQTSRGGNHTSTLKTLDINELFETHTLNHLILIT